MLCVVSEDGEVLISQLIDDLMMSEIASLPTKELLTTSGKLLWVLSGSIGVV